MSPGVLNFSHIIKSPNTWREEGARTLNVARRLADFEKVSYVTTCFPLMTKTTSRGSQWLPTARTTIGGEKWATGARASCVPWGSRTRRRGRVITGCRGGGTRNMTPPPKEALAARTIIRRRGGGASTQLSPPRLIGINCCVYSSPVCHPPQRGVGWRGEAITCTDTYGK